MYGFYFLSFILDRIHRIFRIFFPGFPEESLETPIAFSELVNRFKRKKAIIHVTRIVLYGTDSEITNLRR